MEARREGRWRNRRGAPRWCSTRCRPRLCETGTHDGGEADDKGARVSHLELELHLVDAEVVERVDVTARVQFEGVEHPVDIEEEVGAFRLGGRHGGHSGADLFLLFSKAHLRKERSSRVAPSRTF